MPPLRWGWGNSESRDSVRGVIVGMTHRNEAAAGEQQWSSAAVVYSKWSQDCPSIPIAVGPCRARTEGALRGVREERTARRRPTPIHARRARRGRSYGTTKRSSSVQATPHRGDC